ncbi:MAG: hypothetical protein GC134_09450 [Proteobacteria bacterium]|nr:hypothetical protein [Pseudomonadota bacterium]
MRGGGTLGLIGLLLFLSVFAVFFVTAIWAGVAFSNWLVPLLISTNMSGFLATLLGVIGGFIVGGTVGQVCASVYGFILQLLGVGVGLSLFGRRR